MRFITNILILSVSFLIPFNFAYAQSEVDLNESNSQINEAPYYEAVYDDAYSSEYDSVYDSSDDVVNEEAVGNSENLVVDNVHSVEMTSEVAEDPANPVVMDNEYVKRDNSQTERRHHPHYFMTFGVFGNFHFDSFIGSDNSYTNIFGGLGGSISFGMIGEDFHWAIEQTFGHIWGLRIKSGSKDMTRYDAATLVKASMVTPVKRKLSGVFSIGSGFFYNMPHSGRDAAYGDYLAVDDNGTNLAVAVMISAAIVYDITQYVSFGADLSYIVGIDIGSYAEGEFKDRNGNYSNSDKLVLEILQPGLFFLVKF